MLDILSGKTVEEVEEETNSQLGVNLGATCTPFSVLQSAQTGMKWGKKVYFSQYVIDAMSHVSTQGDFSSKAPDVYCTITNPFNGASLAHIGRFDNAVETTDCPMFMHDSLQPIYGGTGMKTGLGGSQQVAYGTFFQFEITGVKPDGGWRISDQALERLNTNKTAFVPAMVVPVTTPGNEILFGLPYLQKFGLVLDCNTKMVDVSNDVWKFNDQYGQFPQDMKSFLVDA